MTRLAISKIFKFYSKNMVFGTDKKLFFLSPTLSWGNQEKLVFFYFLFYTLFRRKAFSSAGRAAALQAAGHRFESGRA